LHCLFGEINIRRTEQAGQVRYHAPRLMPEQMFQQRSGLARCGHDP